MADKKIIAIFGATGAQGGGLARAIANDVGGGFAARAITRDPNSTKAKDLAKLGVEVVAGNIDDAESIKQALKGAYGAYCVTFFWDHFSPEKEIGEARAMADAAKQAGLQHVIWSTLEDTRRLVPLGDNRMPTLMGKYKVPHFDAKGESDKFFAAAQVPTTYLLTSFYWDNLIGFGMGPKKDPSGKYAFTLPMADKKLPGIAAEDIGRCAYGVFKRGHDLIGKHVGIAGQHLTGTQMAASLAKALRRDVYYNAITPDAFRALGFPGAEDLGNMFQFKRDFEAEFCGTRSLAVSRDLNPQLQTFDAWLGANAGRIPLD